MFYVVVPIVHCSFVFSHSFPTEFTPLSWKKVLTRVKTHGYCGVELKEWSEHIWNFIRCLDNRQFRRVCVAILSRFSSSVSEHLFVLGRNIDAIGPICACWGVCDIFEQWVAAETCGLPLLWLPLIYALFRAHYIEGAWHSLTVLHEGVHCQ